MQRERLRLKATPVQAQTSVAPPPTFLTPKESAAFLRLSEVTLARWRIEGTGPAYRKFGRRVVYAKADLLAWADGQTKQNTSNYRGPLGSGPRSAP